jgi:hypothetical protein
MPAAGSCRICSRPDCKSLDARILAGESINSVAQQIGLPKSSLRCHWDRCRRGGKGLTPRPAGIAPTVPVPVAAPAAPAVPAKGRGTSPRCARHASGLGGIARR